MSEEKRKIRLRTGEPSQTNWFNESFEAKAGTSYEVKESLARMAIGSGKFEYVEAETPDVQTEFDALPEAFPKREELFAGGYKTLSAINSASDEDLIKLDNFGAKSLKTVREAAAQLGDQTNA